MSNDLSTPNALKTAWKMLVHMIGGVDATAACTRATRSMVSEYGNVHGERWAPIDVILEAERIAGEPLVTAALARAQGFKLVPLSAQETAGIGDTLERVAATSSTFLTSTVRALADGHVSESENTELDRGLDDLERAAQTARAALRASRQPKLRTVGAA